MLFQDLGVQPAICSPMRAFRPGESFFALVLPKQHCCDYSILGFSKTHLCVCVRVCLSVILVLSIRCNYKGSMLRSAEGLMYSETVEQRL